jgi:DNA topoisomerase-3
VSKSLILTEKPSVARDIARALGDFEDHKEYLENSRYVVSWAVGHLVELPEPGDIKPEWKAWQLKNLPILPEKFELQPRPDQTRRLNQIKKLLSRKDVEEVINACDAGREGELIFRNILEYLEVKKSTRRLWLQSMTTEAIRQGFERLRPGSDFDLLGDAARCRSEADWLIGMNATRALTRRMQTRTEKLPWSAGRVQTPTLAMLVDRELEILQFRPTPFWRIEARFAASDHEYTGIWFDPDFRGAEDRPEKDDWITDEARLQAILTAVQGKKGRARETRKPSSESAPPPFDLTSLQREANRRFGFSASRTLQAAQRLYEQHKLITYPRTDSRCLPSDYREHVRQVLDMLAGGGQRLYASAAAYLKRNGLQNEKKVFDDGGVSDHFAIIPTTTRAGDLSGDDARIYDLIVRRFLAAFYPPATWIRVERITEVEGHSFRTRARYLKDPGWYEVYGREAAEADEVLPELAPSRALIAVSLEDREPGAEVHTLSAEARAEQTRPPARLTEARLLSLMEHAGKSVEDEHLSRILADKGLGTPATRAEIIENLVARAYAVRYEKALRATPKGILLIDVLRHMKMHGLTSPELTGEMEMHLREVEKGGRSRQAFMDEIKNLATEIVDRARRFEYDELYQNEEPLGDCPLCHRKVYEKARFYACEANAGKQAGCAFVLWKEKGGRYLDRVTVAELLREGQTPLLNGFMTGRGQGYRARLRLNDQGTVEIEPEEGTARPRRGRGAAAGPPTGDAVAACPFAPQDCQILEGEEEYRCQGVCVQKGQHAKGFSLPKMVCRRPIGVEELRTYAEQGRTDWIEDFVSRFNRPFTARLLLKPENGRYEFEFQARKEKPAGKKAAAARGRSKTASSTGAAAGGRGKTASSTGAAAGGRSKTTSSTGAAARGRGKTASSTGAAARGRSKTPSRTGTARKKAPARSTSAQRDGQGAPGQAPAARQHAPRSE